MEKRTLTLDDLLHMEEFGNATFSPNGEQFAFEFIRSVDSGHLHNLREQLRTDIWIMSVRDGKLERITNGEENNAGYWNPLWSPNGNRLALLSIREARIRAWVWDGSTEHLSQVTDLGIPDNLEPALSWISNDKIACLVFPKGSDEPGRLHADTREGDYAVRYWRKSWSGNETTVSVLESDPQANVSSDRKIQLLLIDVVRENQQVVAEGDLHYLLVSPDRRYLAFFKSYSEVPRLNPDCLITHNFIHASFHGSHLCILNLRNENKLIGSIEIEEPDHKSIQWSPAGEELALIGKDSATEDICIFRIRTKDGAVKKVIREELTIKKFSWTDDSHLLVSARSKGDSQQESEWWLVDGNGEWIPTSTGILPNKKDNSIVNFGKPSSSANMKVLSPDGNKAVFDAKDSTGSHLWLARYTDQTSDDKIFKKIWETNTWLCNIIEGEVKQIEYESLDGNNLKGWIILPINYREGRQYPLITWVYAGKVYNDTRPSVTQIYNWDPPYYNLQLWAAQGYAVLLPSIPLDPEGQASDPYSKLPNGVLPAIDKVIELGIVDEKRLGLIGHSYGGYSVYGLVTQTQRFHAAVAMSGFTDLISSYGTFDARCRYNDYHHPQLLKAGWVAYFETGQGRMGNPPWKDRERFVRNSPLTYVERVETPLLIIQGDHDFVPIEQGEEFFTALYRQGKRARFVRYFGEGHVIEGQANMLDMWKRICEWFDKWLK
jgi:dipeptidyl aminopeptidase/acylaminoacyl peptidase